jgi:hypothetical protein
LTWIRRNTSDDAVLAVNNYFNDARRRNPAYMYYSGFAERRVFLEGWGYTIRGQQIGADKILEGVRPFPKRLALDRAAFAHADPVALGKMVRTYGVDYLLADRLNAAKSPALSRLARPVYSNRDVQIFDAASVARMARMATRGVG